MKFLLTITLFVLVTLTVPAQVRDEPGMARPFKTDNCTWFPDGNYADCCVEHDKEYYVGGSLKQRREADKRLKECVASKGKGWKRKFLANAMYIGVRVGGVHFLPTPFRWGFGHKWPRKEPKKPKVEEPEVRKTKDDH